MRSLSTNVLRLATAVLLCGLSAGAALADIATYTTVLAGANEVPAVATLASGTATLVVDTETLEAAWTLEFFDLSSAQTGAHFHNAPAGTNGGVVFALTAGSPAGGVWAMSQAQLDMLAAGNIYVNVHSTMFPGGEIRGQMALADTVPDQPTSFGGIKALFR